MNRPPFPLMGESKPVAPGLEDIYVEETCGWCGANLVKPEMPAYPGQLICLNACHLPAGTLRKFNDGLRAAMARVEAEEGER